MADLYWVGGSGSISDNANHWAATSGGAAGAALPDVGDNIFFDANSGAGTVFADVAMTVNNMDQTGDSVSVYGKVGGGLVSVRGDAVISGNSTSTSLFFKFDTQANTTSVLTSLSGTSASGHNAIYGGAINVNAAGTVKLGAGLGIGAGASGWRVQNGSLDTNGQTLIVASSFVVDNTANEKFILNNSLLKVNGNLTFSGTVATIDTSTGTIQLASNGDQVLLGGNTIERMEILGGLKANHTDFNDQGWTINYLYISNDASGRGVGFEPSATENNITTLEAVGEEGNLIEFTYVTPGSAGTYKLCVTNSIVSYLDVEYLDASCGNPVANPNGTDGGNNTNVLFGEGAVWFEGIKGAHNVKPKMDEIYIPNAQLMKVASNKPQISIIETKKPLLA